MVHYECRGKGPAVVFVAGLGGLGAFWQPVMARLQDAFTVITFDHPGTGRSASRGPQSIPALADAVRELAAGLDIPRFTVVGHSTGGLVAQALALDHPEVLDAIVLSCAWAAPDRRFRELFALRRQVLTGLGLAAYKLQGHLLAYPPADDDRFPPPAPPAGEDDPAEVALTAARIDMLLGYSRADELARIAVPTLVIGAADDPIVPDRHAAQLAAAIPGAQRISLVGGHFPPLTQTDAYTSRLREFLETH